MASTIAKRTVQVLGIIVATFVALFVLLIFFLTIFEYNPADEESVAVHGKARGILATNEVFDIVSWNIGYAGLSPEADFFMDGGSKVRSVSREGVLNNLAGIRQKLEELGPDFILLQEVDRFSDRTYYINEQARLATAFGDRYASASALNHNVPFVPFPVPPMGTVGAGVQTLSSVQPASATRIQLPCPFSWPIRVANLKRCLLVERIPVADSEAELVLINLHLEAYDEGDGKEAQTAQLATLMQEELGRGNYVIAGGDFNQIFSNVDEDAYPSMGDKYWKPGLIDIAAFGGNFEALMDVSTPTCRSLDRPYDGSDDFQYYMIDGFIVSDNVRVESLSTLDTDFEYSDHNPVVLQASLL